MTLRQTSRILIALLAAGLLVYLLHRVGFDTIGQAFGRLGWQGALVILAMGLLENAFNALALVRAVGGRVGFFNALCYNGAGAIINSVIPWESGEIVKGTLLRRHLSGQDAVCGTVVWNYLLKLSTPVAGLTASVIALVVGHELAPALAWAVVGLSVLSFLPYLGLRYLLNKGVAGGVIGFLRRVRLIRKDPAELQRWATELDGKLKEFHRDHPRDWLAMFLFQIGARTTVLAGWFVSSRLLGYEYEFGTCALVFSGFSIASYVLMVIPAKIGVNEGTGYALFAAYGLDGGAGLITTVVGHLRVILTNGVAALFAFAGSSRKSVF